MNEPESTGKSYCPVCGYPAESPPQPLSSAFSEADRLALTQALCEAFEKSAPTLSQALSDALQAQFERLIGRGIMAWVKRILLAGILAMIGYTVTKSGGLK